MSSRIKILYPTTPKLGLVHRFFGVIESKQASDRLILRVLFFATLGGLLSAAIIFNNSFVSETPAVGGTIIEGIIGTPRFVNPALAVTRADQDMTALIYAGLMKINQSGTLVPDLAESITPSDDGKTYNVLLRPNLQFHDGTTLTAHDVAFTIGLIQNPELKSPLRGNWSGVAVEEISDTELNIVLEEAYSPFIENFTLGILPRHLWNDLKIEQVPFSQLNTAPIGAGPFAISHTEHDSTGLINSYTLTSFSTNEPVQLASFEIKFYQNEDELVTAFSQNEIMSSVYLPTTIMQEIANTPSHYITQEPLPRVFAVFFNQNRSAALRDTAVRLALAAAIPRTELVHTALQDYGVPIVTPVPVTSSTVESISQTGTSTLEQATTILTRAGWIKDNTGGWEKRIDGETQKLSISLRTANSPLFEQTTEIIARAWRELGVEVKVEQFQQGDLLQAVIRPRDFEALLFGLDMSRAVDLYPFWHSSQREDPGLNIAQYANIEVDRLLTSARTASTTEARDAAVSTATSIITREVPAIFLFVPNVVYVQDSRVTMTPISHISKPSERFMNVNEWHMNTDTLWPLFK